jgi:cytochrome c-type biogenesis protein CcmF
MLSIGQLCLLAALVCSGYAAFAAIASRFRPHRLLQRAATASGLMALALLTGVVVILAWALVTTDFRFDYVVHYSSRLLPWQYSLAALWVGQAGSLLLWAWMLAGLAVVFRWLPAAETVLRDSAFGVLMGCLAFLIAIMVFAADPMKASLTAPKEGLGLSPLLQHPSMLIHPPVIFFGYAAWTVPFALAIAALFHDRLDATWTQMARPWALLAWSILGAGLLLGAHWAYQELGWGGYWGWDPVENGSLMPWLTGTALIHCLMAWRYRNCLKKTAISLAILTFGLCNFATFLTRSGLFSSVHAFSESPIGWMFLGLMAVLLTGGMILIIVRRKSLAAERTARSLLARETLILVSTFLLVVFTLVVMASTLVAPLSAMFLGRTILVGAPIYNNVLSPVGLLLIAGTALVPMLRWNEAPGPAQCRVLWVCAGAAALATAAGYWLGARHILSLTVTGLAALGAGSILGALFLDARRRQPQRPWRGVLQALGNGRRQYAGYLVHLGVMALAIGITASSLGTGRHEAVMDEGEVIRWGEWEIRYVQLVQRELPDKLVAEALLEVSRGGNAPVMLRPARHLHLLQNEWTTEVAIHSTWGGDFYTILDAGLGDGRVALTFVDNPMMRCVWLGGIVACLGAVVAMWPGAARRLGAGNADKNQSACRDAGADDGNLRHAA